MMSIFQAAFVPWFAERLLGSLGASKLNAVYTVSQEAKPFGIDMSIEGMNSQEFSVAIFYFLIAAIVVFTIFVFMFMFKDRASKLKLGEKLLFVWILLG